LVRTTQGKFVLRYYRQNRHLILLFEANLIASLKRKNYPCPAILRDRHGKLVGLYQDKPYALFEFMEGTCQAAQRAASSS
jgi:Ser/Thr protein kinase RdoA (MazF antagonist)